MRARQNHLAELGFRDEVCSSGVIRPGAMKSDVAEVPDAPRTPKKVRNTVMQDTAAVAPRSPGRVPR